MSLNQTTQELIDQGEFSNVEFIASVEQKDHVAQAVCGFLNTKGGTVIVGIHEKLEKVSQLTPSQAQKIERFLRQEISPKTLFSVSLDEVDGGRVISIGVPKGADRPYVYRGAIHVRVGRRVKLAEAEAIRVMIREDCDTPRWERQVASGVSLDDLKRGFIDDTVEAATANRGMTFEQPKDIELVLKQLSMLQFGEVTHAADVLFGKWVASHHPQTRVRAVAYESDRAADRYIDENVFEGPLLNIYEDVMAFLRRHVSIANEFVPGQMARITKPQYPFTSLREGLVNALVHRDYSAYSGGVTISVYPARIEISNTGRLPQGLSLAMLRQAKHESILVNPDICNIFYLNGLMERLGRGTFNIVNECKEFGLPTPKWNDTASGIRLTFFTATSNGNDVAVLNPRQREIISSLNPKEMITAPEFVERFADDDVSERQARRDLAELVELGYFVRFGSARATAYERTELMN